MVVSAVALVTACSVALTGCEQTHGGPASTPPAWARGNGPRVLAELTRHWLGSRVTGLVDVSHAFPDAAAIGAYVLIDAHIGTHLPRDDFLRRPVLAVYRTPAAARRAAARSDGNAFATSNRVMYLPEGFPARLGRRYQQAAGVGLA